MAARLINIVTLLLLSVTLPSNITKCKPNKHFFDIPLGQLDICSTKKQPAFSYLRYLHELVRGKTNKLIIHQVGKKSAWDLQYGAHFSKRGFNMAGWLG